MWRPLLLRDPMLVVAFSLLAARCISFYTPTPGQLQRRYVDRTRPVPLEKTQKWTGPIRKLRVNVYADVGHRRSVLGWQARFYQLIRRVNPVFAAAIGVELEVMSMQAWARSAEVGGLESALHDLARHDDGGEVDIVIGLVAPLTVLTNLQMELGRAQLLGHHLVMRPGDDVAQYDVLEKGLDAIGDDRIEDLYNALRRRREELILLHEVGHLLGALHVSSETNIMAPVIDAKITGFSPENVGLMRAVLAARFPQSEGAPINLADTYREALLGAAEGAFDPEARARMIALVESGPSRLARATQADVSPPPAAADDKVQPGPVGDAAVAQRAAELASESPKAAWLLFEPVLKRHPNEPQYQTLACRLGLQQASKVEDAVAFCNRAVELAPTEPEPRLLRAAAHVARTATKPAVQDARVVDAMLTRTSTADPELWALLASLYRTLSAVTWAQRASERSEDESLRRDIAAWVAKMRQTYGLPASGGGLAASEEPVYFELRRRLAAAARAGDVREQSRLAAELRRRYPQRPVPPAGCKTLIEARKWPSAYRVCRAAAKAAPDSVNAQTLVAVAAFGIGKPNAAVRPLERAIALAPKRKATWRLLASAYRASGNVAALKKLRAEYQQRFGRPLR